VIRTTVAGGMTGLAIGMAVNTVIGLYYYLAWAARTFAAPAAAPVPAGRAPGGGTGGTGGTGVPGRMGTLGGTERAVGLAIGTALVGAVVLSVLPQLVFHVGLPVSIIPG
jgi:NADH-quinone oxidoreductase subunit N